MPKDREETLQELTNKAYESIRAWGEENNLDDLPYYRDEEGMVVKWSSVLLVLWTLNKLAFKKE